MLTDVEFANKRWEVNLKSKELADILLSTYVRKGKKYVLVSSPEGLEAVGYVAGKNKVWRANRIISFLDNIQDILLWHSIKHDISLVTVKYITEDEVAALGIELPMVSSLKWTKETREMLDKNSGK